MSQTIFKINVLNWDKHNGGKKKNHRYFLMENRFFEDAKISQLKQIEVLFYLKCLTIAGDLSSSCIEVHAGLMPKRWRVDVKSMENCCKTLQSFQLLTYEKFEPFLNTIQEKRKEKKTIQDTVKTKIEKKVEPENQNLFTDSGESLPAKYTAANLIGLYCDHWKVSYRSTQNPVISPKDAKSMKSFLENVGKDRAEEIVKTYLKMPDKWFLTKKHDIPTMLASTNAVIHFMETGRIVTSKELNNLEKSAAMENVRRDIRENGI